MKKYLQLIRVRQYIKNGLIFIAAFFAKNLFEKNTMFHLLAGFVSFSFFCSFIYIINDIRDAKKDKLHPIKYRRPIAAGTVSKYQALGIGMVLLISGYVILSLTQGKWMGGAHYYVLVYVVINLGYSLGLKNVPILDILILASGFLIRVLYGAALCDIRVSNWLYLTIFMISLYMGAGKRKNEKIGENGEETRAVLQFYSVNYIEKIMQMSMILAVTFYSLWSSGMAERNSLAAYMIWTVPIILAIIMRYEMLVEKTFNGDPTEIILADRILQILIVIYGVIGLGLLYS